MGFFGGLLLAARCFPALLLGLTALLDFGLCLGDRARGSPPSAFGFAAGEFVFATFQVSAGLREWIRARGAKDGHAEAAGPGASVANGGCGGGEGCHRRLRAVQFAAHGGGIGGGAVADAICRLVHRMPVAMRLRINLPRSVQAGVEGLDFE